MNSSPSYHPARKLSSLAVFTLACCWTAISCHSGSSSQQPPPDTTPPTAPTNLVATATSPAQVNLSWTASTDNVGVTGYRVERCQGPGCTSFAQIATPTTASFDDTGLTGSTSYSYRVRASDAAANLSSYSSVATVSTPAPTLTAPARLLATAVSSTQINLTWTASSEVGGTISGYLMQSCSGPGCSGFATIGSPATTSFNNTGLTPSTSYSYVVIATDALGNRSSSSNVATATTPANNISVSITPQLGGITTSQTLALAATVANDVASAGVTWSAGGGTLTNQTTTSASFSSSSAGSVTVTATSNADNTKSASAVIGVTDLTGVFTYQNDVQRTGQNLHEFALTTANVNSTTFGQLFSCDASEGGTVPGHVYAQPLYVANLNMPDGKTHNVVYIATQSDFVYAFDADASPCQQLWKQTMLATGETTIPAGDTGEPDDVHPEIGITSTPVIDPSTNTIYVCAKSKDASANYHARLHALDLLTGNEKANSPLEISSTTVNSFDPLIEAQRPALLLAGSNVYLGFGSHGDQNSYHGYLLGYDKTALTLQFTWTATDLSVGSTKGAIWQAGAGPALDSSGNIWVEIANGDFDGSSNFGDSVVKVNPAAVAPAPTVVDFFTPMDQATLAANDIDLGSGGVTILPDGLGNTSHLHLALAGGKTDLLYLLDQNNLGHFNSSADSVVQEVTLPNGLNEGNITGGMFSKAAYFNGNVYVLPIQDVLHAFSVSNAALTQVATAGDVFGYPGATPSISAQGNASGIVWVVNTTNNNSQNGSGTQGPAVLYAYDASTLNGLFNSPTVAIAVKFVVPTVANGKVYVGGEGAVSVFGLLP